MQEAPTANPENSSSENAEEYREPAIRIKELDFLYGNNQVIHNVTLDIFPKEIMAFIGPSGCGKSTLLRCLNRMNDLVDGARIGKGSIEIHGVDLHDKSVDVIELRKKVGMVFQKSNPVLSVDFVEIREPFTKGGCGCQRFWNGPRN